MSIRANALLSYHSCRRTELSWRAWHTGIRAAVGISTDTSMAWRSCRQSESLTARSDRGFRVGSAQSAASVPA